MSKKEETTTQEVDSSNDQLSIGDLYEARKIIYNEGQPAMVHTTKGGQLFEKAMDVFDQLIQAAVNSANQ